MRSTRKGLPEARSPTHGHAHGTQEKGKGGGNPNRPRFWGKHAVAAALDNPDRKVLKAWATREAAASCNFPTELPVIMAEAPTLAGWCRTTRRTRASSSKSSRWRTSGSADLLADAPETAVLLVLDQVTDPHNVGAILRSAAAFGAIGIVTQDRHSPPESGALAKAASGALERVPWVRVVNLARALEEIAEAGFWRIGLAGDADYRSEGRAWAASASRWCWAPKGLACGPTRASIAMRWRGCRSRDAVESLNVSNAAAIALYAASVA